MDKKFEKKAKELFNDILFIEKSARKLPLLNEVKVGVVHCGSKRIC